MVKVKFYVVLWIILDSKNDKNSDNFILFVIVSCRFVLLVKKGLTSDPTSPY